MNRERRMISGRVETRSLTDKEKADGYIGAITGVIPLNSDSVTLRDRRLNNGQPFVERIASKAFAGAEDVMAVAGHSDDTLMAFARQGVNLTIAESDNEIRWDALVPDTTAGRDLLKLGEKKIVRGTSFEFDLGAEDKWEKRGDGTAVRTVVRGKLSTVNPVIWPAYDDSDLSVSMRSRRRASDRRGFYAYDSQEWSDDYTATCDLRYAQAALAAELCELDDALDYLRCIATPGTSATGALKAYAEREVQESASAVAELTAWMAAKGAIVNPDLLERAKKTETEARKVTGSPETISTPDRAARERRARALRISPASPFASAT